MQFHLVLVYLPFVENLVYQQQQALRIAVDGVNILQTLLVGNARLQFLQRTHDECQRRTDIVCGIDQEPHLRLLQHLLVPALYHHEGEGGSHHDQQEIDQISQWRSVPWLFHPNRNGLGLFRVDTIAERPYLNDIFPRFHLVERDSVCSFVEREPVVTPVDTILESDVVRVLEGKQRELHRERILVVGHGEIVFHGTTALSVNNQVRQEHIPHLHITVLHITGVEGRNTIVCAKTNHSIGGLEHCAQHIFLIVQSVTIDMSYPFLGLTAVLPDTHRRAHPDVFLTVGNNAVDEFVVQRIRMWEAVNLVLDPVEDKETCIRSNQDIPLSLFTERITLNTCQHFVPAVLLETARLGIHTCDSIGASDPQKTVSVDEQSPYPVVRQTAQLSSILVHAVNGAFPRVGVIDNQSFTIVAYIHRSLPVIR